MRLVTYFLFLILTPAFVQAQYGLSGNISGLSGAPFGYCKLIIGQDSIDIQTIDADTSGNYKFENLSAGAYELQIMVPFETIDTLIQINGNTTFNLVIDDAVYLEDFVITREQKTIIRKVDRTIFNPDNIPALVGGNALDVFEFAPGVYINGDNIQVAGGGSAQVMLNDKIIPLSGMQLVSFVRSIPTEDIQYIEIIPIPPVKYAANVQGSLINIKLVTGAKSRHSKGSVNIDIGQRFYSQQGISGNYSYRAGKFSLYANGNVNNYKFRSVESETIGYDTLQWNQNSVEVFGMNSLSGSVGLNYEINSSTEIGVLAVADGFRGDGKERSFVEKTGRINYYGRIDNLTSTKDDNAQAAFNMNLVKRFDSIGKRLDLNVDYTNYGRKKQINFETTGLDGSNTSLSSERNRTLTSANLLSGGIDYIHPVKGITLSAGARYSYSENTSELSVFNNLINPDEKDTSRSNVFDYFEQIQAGYASMDWKIKRWSFQVGLRGENTIYRAVSPDAEVKISNSYFQLTPKAFAMYESEKGQFWNFNYSRNFYRPYYSDLNPFRYYTSAYNFTTGNPNLKPVVLNSLSVSTQVSDLQFRMSFLYIDKMQTDVTIYDNATQTQQTTASNLFSSSSADFSVSYYKLIKKRTSIDLYLSCMYTNRKVTATIAPQNLNAFTGFLNFSFSYVPDKKESLTFKTSISYHTPYFEQIELTKTKPFIDLNVKKNLANNRITLELSCNDPFKLQRKRSRSYSNQTVIEQSGYFDSQSFVFSFSYKLGNNNLDVNQHSTNTTGEAGRVSK